MNKSLSSYKDLQESLKNNSKKWLITGVAGFIGSNILENLLKLNQQVVGVDNFSTGHDRNLKEVQKNVSSKEWNNFNFYNGDICNYDDCLNVVKDIDFVSHQAALGSVPRSIKQPLDTNSSNITGFLNILEASRLANVKSFTYASSSSVYGNHPDLPKTEENIGEPLSPYAATKYVNEIYARVFSRTYDFKSIGLRYFNVFGPRQDPKGPYAAVIPKWIKLLIENEEVEIYGDGETSRDFCFVENVVQMNILSAIADSNAKDDVYNVACGNQTSLTELFFLLKKALIKNNINISGEPSYKDFRAGDIRHSKADISKSVNKLNYSPTHDIEKGINDAIGWYIQNLKT